MIKNISVIGGGLMGSQLALYFNNYGIDVTVIHRSIQSQQFSENRISQMLNSSKWKAILHRTPSIKHSTDINAIKNSELIIEAISEQLESKKDLYKQMIPLLGNNQIIASVSTALPMAMFLPIDYKGEYYNLHFFNPVVANKTVEVAGNEMGKNRKAIINFLESFGFNVISVKNEVGFLITKLALVFWNKAINEFERLNVSSEKFDSTIKDSLAHASGPLEVADLIGFQTYKNACSNLYSLTNDKDFMVPNLITKLMEKGFNGKSNGKGFYKWDGNKKIESNDIDM